MMDYKIVKLTWLSPRLQPGLIRPAEAGVYDLVCQKTGFLINHDINKQIVIIASSITHDHLEDALTIPTACVLDMEYLSDKKT